MTLKIKNLLPIFCFVGLLLILQTTAFAQVTLGSENKNTNDKCKSNQDYFRAIGYGKSSNINIARKIALLNAKSDIASSVKTSFSKTTELYLEESKTTEKEALQSKFEENQKEIVEQELQNLNIVEENQKQTEKGFEFWICIEMPKKKLIDTFITNTKTAISFDAKRYNDIFMNKVVIDIGD